MDSQMPPVPPSVAAQQGGTPPMQQYAQSASQGGGGQQQSSDQLMAQYIDQVGQGMTKIAQIAQQSKPELVPILKQAVQAMAMFASKVKSGGAQQGGPDGGNQGTAGGGAPDAAGGAAMGMPQ